MRTMPRILLISLFLCNLGVSTLAADPIAITGKVLVDGAAVANAQVLLILLERRIERTRHLLTPELDPAAVATAKTDRQGNFEIEAPGVGMWKVRVEAAPELGEPGAAQVTLIGPDGQPHQELTRFGHLQSAFFLYQGRLEFEQLQAGTYNVTVEVEDGRQWTETVNIVPGVPSTVEMR